ncbi:MAG: 3-phosphoserine/phosphohydroxythreonine transaminase [Endozoicomonadaceae bacterium]|nr:3-phosphoserine/phosphohydroxythreonine transaminase [Endozoicomonadaceae bacterium]
MSKRTYNFSPGPAALPVEILEQIRDELLDWKDCGYSVMESSHRDSKFIETAEEAEQNLRDIMSIPSNYKVLFCAGGASFQFAAIPLNFSGKNKNADYFCTGIWSEKAAKEAQRYCNVNIVAKTDSAQFMGIARKEQWQLSKEAAYVFYTPNETVSGIRFPTVPETHGVPLVADMTSCILQEDFDVNQFGLIFAGVQKNIAPAGMTIVIVRDDFMDQAMSFCPSLLNYKIIDEYKSMPNTPPTFSWYVANLTFQWVKKHGGVKAMEALSYKKSAKLYEVIDSTDFYSNKIHFKYRSVINVPFHLHDSTLDPLFIQEAEKNGIRQIKGHKSEGGMRASLYNGVNEEAVNALAEFMKAFEKRHG